MIKYPFSEGVFRLTQRKHVFEVFRKTVIVQAFVDSKSTEVMTSHKLFF